jgi:hypothetical protein
MDTGTYPFPLAANSCHHSRYHRFLLGADPAILAPFPKPYCQGALVAPMRRLAETLTLQSWRKLFHGAIPWVEGFGPEHYAIGNVPAHRPLPRDYRRPLRRFGAFDFVQAADPSLTALALVAGDQRLIQRFALLGNTFCSEVETDVQARGTGPAPARWTGRLLAGQFLEPNNRWLMPYLHVHARVLNFTSPAEAPQRLACLDREALARAGARANRDWVAGQAGALSELGYRVAASGGARADLRVDGVGERLLAAMEAPRIAVLRLLERIVLGGCEPSADRLGAEMPPAVLAAMAEQLETFLARSLAFHKPPKVSFPSEGPWRDAVREHLRRHCPEDLALLDAAARQARAVPLEAAIFPAPPLDPAHAHAPALADLRGACQLPGDPELGAGIEEREPIRAPSLGLVREFEETLTEVNDRLVRVGLADPLVALRRTLARIDHPTEGADPEQLRQAAVLLDLELDRRMAPPGRDFGRSRAGPGGPEEWAELVAFGGRVGEREIGGRSL